MKAILWMLMENGKPMFACARKAPLVQAIKAFYDTRFHDGAIYTIVKMQAARAPEAPMLSAGLRGKR